MNKTKKNKGRMGSFISVLCFMVIGAGCGFAVLPVLDYVLEDNGNVFIAIMALFLMLSLMYVSLYLEMGIHELGHLFFGLRTGYSFVSYRIGSVTIIKEEGKLVRKKYSLPGTGGQCLMSPPLYGDSMPYVLYNAGGAIFNFLSSVIFFLLFLLSMDVPFLSSFLLMTVFVSVGLGAMNIIPLIYGNDGSNILSIKKSPLERKCFWAQMKMASETMNDIRLKDMGDEIFPVRSKNEVDGVMSSSAFVYYANRLLDSGDFEGALKVGNEALSSPLLVPVLRSALSFDKIYCLLLLSGEKEGIDRVKDKKLIKEMKAMRSMLGVMRTEYTYALLYEGNITKAEEIKRVFEESAKTYPSQSEVEGERFLMDKAYQKYQES